MMMELLLDCLRKTESTSSPLFCCNGHRSSSRKLQKISLEMEIIERQQFSGNWDALPKVVGRQIYSTTPNFSDRGIFTWMQFKVANTFPPALLLITVSLGINARNQRNYTAGKRSLAMIMAGKLVRMKGKGGTGEQEKTFPQGWGACFWEE